MPKGDRELYKADLDDGFTKIANLLLEALAMAKLNGVQKGICLFLWRRTYGWGTKEDQISLREFARACDSSESYISRQIKQLVNWKVILRTSYEPGKVPTFTINTRVAEWDKGCLNVQGLHECESQGLYKCARVPFTDCARVDKGSALEPQEVELPLNKSLKKDINKYISPPTPNAREGENLFLSFEQEFGRPLSPMETERITIWEKEHYPELITEALKRAVTQGKTNMRYIESILSDWKKNNIRTLLEVKRQDKEFEERKQKGGITRGANNQSNGESGGHYKQIRGPDAGKDKFPGYDRSKFEFPG